jgi:hypothetical protein
MSAGVIAPPGRSGTVAGGIRLSDAEVIAGWSALSRRSPEPLAVRIMVDHARGRCRATCSGCEEDL